jgi:hypothetical protein
MAKDDGVELRPAFAPKNIHHKLMGSCLPVVSGCCHCVVAIRQQDNSGADRNVLSRKPIGIASPIEGFVMMPYSAAYLRSIAMCNRVDYLLPQCRVGFHGFPLVRLEATWFEQDSVGYTDFPHIVQSRSRAEDRKFLGTEFTTKTKLQTERFNTATVACCVRVSFFESDSKAHVLFVQGKRPHKYAFGPVT